ncbi:hypothetical protein SDC9_101986 [bioreactor metagenome]|uniref:Uncharacterized protein (DUF2164 family) n=2 Tax=root TaxID=1 RepID=A0A562JEL1_9FIRM|nr:DUF2164 domain-containing protein [Sedimentibacter saalensis]MEA5096708.1 DUF2164 domain-containing protein [Sedimentibacter saalensis]TWH81637.1 uncharacterized protein (DUF2164 family) [Sedimentibacter saalensis]
MNKKNKIELPKEKREEMILKIKNYFLNERDEELGDLASIMIFEFITEELAAEFYNQGVYDSYKYMNDRCEDLLSIQKY